MPAETLVAFYKSYRACVRAKVAALRADQLQGEAQAAAAREAQLRLTLADEYAAPWLRPKVLAVGGVAGTGKTTLATAVADALGARLLRTDVIRKELFANSSQDAMPDGGIYSPSARKQTYEHLFHRGRELHAQRVSIVLDGTFSTLDSLAAAQEIVAGAEGAFLAVECVCRSEVAHERIRRRMASGGDASDARPEIHDLQRQRWPGWPADVAQVRIDTEQPLAQQVEIVLRALATKAGPKANPL
jgi:predicted kinase